MRAVVCHQPGDLRALVVEEVPDPVAGPGQVLIDIEAAGVNYVDALFVQGRYQIKPQPPFVPGSEVAGVVSALGPGIESDDDEAALHVGDRVLANLGLGGFAEQAVAAAGAVACLPEQLDAARAATFTQSYSTAWFSLVTRSGIQPGESVLVLGAGGGVGLAAVDIARALGARVIAVASTPDKRRAAQEAGAAGSIDPSAETLKTAARTFAGGSGVDIVVDPIGGSLAEPALRALGEGGRYLVIGFASGDIPSLPLNQVLLRNRRVLGIDWGAWGLKHPAEQGRLLDALLQRVRAGDLHPRAPHSRPWTEAAEALEDLLSRRVVGKLALDFTDLR